MTYEKPTPDYKTIRQFAEAYPAFTIASLRDLVFYADFNGLNQAGVIKRVGAKILINTDKFFAWVETNPSTKGVKNGK